MFPGVWIKKMLLFLIVEPYLQTRQDLCVVQGTGAGKKRQPAPQSKLRELRQRAPLTAKVHWTVC